LVNLNEFIAKEGIDRDLGPSKVRKVTEDLFEHRSQSTNYRPVMNNLSNDNLVTIQRNSINRNNRGAQSIEPTRVSSKFKDNKRDKSVQKLNTNLSLP